MPDGTLSRTEVIVTDGVTVGCPCCAVLQCTNSLASTHHRFCSVDPTHQALETTCAVDGCDRPVTHDSQSGRPHKARDDPLHFHMEALNVESLRTGKSWTRRQKGVTLDDTMAALHPTGSALPVQDGDKWYELYKQMGDTRLVQPAVTTSTGVSEECEAEETQVKLKAIFRCQRTNNEQLDYVSS
ncbi:hypothetical protein P692DRAFT_20745212 [Suillus brevipes Sb2]|nr:hypothetical protein P692DRAFT_20745212 [Suillus brevipes Sb2]